jgi:hypothetical protein
MTLYPNPTQPIWNRYTCDTCGRDTITKHEDLGTTPMFVNCRATLGCEGTGVSHPYGVSQDPNQVPHVLWWRPKTEDAMNRELAK